MPEALGGALAAPGFGWLALTVALAGLVRGFTGFGTALVFMPVGGLFLPLPVAIVVLSVVDLVTLPVILPRAWPVADRREVGLLVVAALLTVPLGVGLLTLVPGDALRWAVAAAAGLTLAALVSGWRFHGRVGRPGLAAIGAASGLLGGATGLSGPPVILFYLAGPAAAARVRANTIVFLAAIDLVVTANLVARGLVGGAGLALALLLAAPFGLGLFLGQRLFAPGRERAFRAVAYLVIAGAILAGLPLFG